MTRGPTEALADFIGLDACLAVLRSLHEGFGDSKYRPAPLLVKMVDAGRLGCKTGRGFYNIPARLLKTANLLRCPARAFIAAYLEYAWTHLRWVPRPGYPSDQDG